MVGLVGLLMALLLPAVVQSREAARRTQCVNNLKQIGLALHLYHNARDTLPAGMRDGGDPHTVFGWAIDLLPSLDRPNLANSIDAGLSLADSRHDRARGTTLSFMLCPADVAAPAFTLREEAEGDAEDRPAAHTSEPGEPLATLPAANYVGVFGTLEADDDWPAPEGDGPMIAERGVRFSALRRGLSNTLVVGERIEAMVPSTWFGVDKRGEDAACRLLGSAITQPNCEVCDECEFASRHPGGSNFVWGDGHVSMVSGGVDRDEYRTLARRCFGPASSYETK